MLNIVYSIFPILLALVLGNVLGRSLPNTLPAIAAQVIGPLVWLLLLSIGIEFGSIFKDPAAAGKIIYTAGIFSILTTIGACLLIYVFYKSNASRQSDMAENKTINISEPIRECIIALSMVFLGVMISIYISQAHLFVQDLEIADILLYVLIFFVGIDIVSVKLTSSWGSVSFFLIPVLVIVGSIAGGVISSLIIGEDLMTSLAISSGFGWFTLSGVLVSSKIGVTYGAIALMTDLFRELFAIILMYVFGRGFSNECIGAGGATTLDSTLPIIKQTCSKEAIPIALVSGLILTLLAPVLISFFLSNSYYRT